MRKTASSRRVARMYLLASVNVPVLEEVLPNTFSRIEPFNRVSCSHDIMESLKAEKEFNQETLLRVLSEYTQADTNLIMVDVSHLFSDVGVAQKEKLLSVLTTERKL